MGVYTDQDLDDLMKENLRLTRENNELLRKMRRGAILGFWFKLVLYLVILGLPVFVYWMYLQEYAMDAFSLYETAHEILQNPNGVPSESGQDVLLQ